MPTDIDALNLGLLLLRLTLAVVMAAHGYNHIFGGGRIEGTAGWFESLGMKPGRLHAWLASLTELAVAPLLALGLLTPLGAAGTIGVLTVAWITNHRDAGFWVFNRPTEGWEYLMTLIALSFGVAMLGPGEWSIDHALEIVDDLAGWTGLLIALIAGVGGALATLAVFWRPEPSEET